MTRPPTVPTWCTTGTRVAATSGKILVGFAGGEKPAAQILNNLLGLTGDWLGYLSENVDPMYFGTGIDGAVHFDGTSTVLGLTPNSDVYTLTRDIVCTAITIDSGATIITAGFRIFCQGTLANAGTIQWNGYAASGQTGGAALSSGGVLPGSGAGASGPNAGVHAGNNASAANPGFPPLSVAAAAGIAGNGPTGGTCAGGAGGGYSGEIGGNGGAVTAMGGSHGCADLLSALRGVSADGTVWVTASGGGSGSATLSTAGRGGGGGAGTVVVCARAISGSGVIEANGGAGANNTSLEGAGGGGGGGIVLAVYGTNANTIQALGGAGGTGATEMGGPGGAGLILTCNLSGDGT